MFWRLLWKMRLFRRYYVSPGWAKTSGKAKALLASLLVGGVVCLVVYFVRPEVFVDEAVLWLVTAVVLIGLVIVQLAWNVATAPLDQILALEEKLSERHRVERYDRQQAKMRLGWLITEASHIRKRSFASGPEINERNAGDVPASG